MLLSTNNILKEVKAYAIMTLGFICYAFAWTAILLPAQVMGGGAGGVSLLVYHFTGGENGGVPIGTTFLIFNAILLVIGCFTIGFKFGAKTIYGILVMSLLLSLGQTYIPADFVQLQDDKLLSAILGGVLCGLGVAVGFSQGGSTGGTDIVAMIVNKYFRVSLGRTIVYCDIIIVGLAYFIFEDISAIVYGYITMGVVGYSIDMIMSGGKQTVQVMVSTKKYEEIADVITSELGRGVTLLKSVGWYTKNEGYVLMTFCRRSELVLINRAIKMVDPDAFVSNATVTGVYGRGFEELVMKNKKKIIKKVM